jgi:hypothetical protein
MCEIMGGINGIGRLLFSTHNPLVHMDQAHPLKGDIKAVNRNLKPS